MQRSKNEFFKKMKSILFSTQGATIIEFDSSHLRSLTQQCSRPAAPTNNCLQLQFEVLEKGSSEGRKDAPWSKIPRLIWD